MPTSTMADLKANLLTDIGDLGTFLGVQLTYGDAGGLARKERVWLGSVENGDSQPPAFRAGKQRRRESYVLHIWIEVVLSTPQLAEARAIALAGAIEDMIASDPKVSATPNLLFARCDGLEMDTTEHAEGALTSVDVSVYCEGDVL